MNAEEYHQAETNNPLLTWLDTVTVEEFTALNRELERQSEYTRSRMPEAAEDPEDETELYWQRERECIEVADRITVLELALEAFPQRNPDRAWELIQALSQSEFEPDRSFAAASIDKVATAMQPRALHDNEIMQDIAELWCSLIIDNSDGSVVSELARHALVHAIEGGELEPVHIGHIVDELAFWADLLNNGGMKPARPYRGR